MALTAKGRATRTRIIEGAAAHLHSAEPGEMTLDDVRAITATSKGQLFHYFPGGKEELLLAVARHEADGPVRPFAQPLGRLGEAAGAEALVQQGVDGRPVFGPFRAEREHRKISS